MKLKWEKRYPSNYVYDGRIEYVCGEYSIMKTNSLNMWTGRPMSEQMWRIYHNGIPYKYDEITLKEAKQTVEKLMSV